MSDKLARSFYSRPAENVARDLLGKVLARQHASSVLRARIVEVEAYAGQNDPGSHAFRGQTRRTRVMFGPPGHLYVYFTYGMHYCMNVVTDREGIAGAVLLRAAEPLAGFEVMERLRGPRPVVDLCSGPAKLCEAFDITRKLDGADLEGDVVWIEDDGFVSGHIDRSTRVGLSQGRELPLRFFLPDSPFVSRGKPSAPLVIGTS